MMALDSVGKEGLTSLLNWIYHACIDYSEPLLRPRDSSSVQSISSIGMAGCLVTPVKVNLCFFGSGSSDSGYVRIDNGGYNGFIEVFVVEPEVNEILPGDIYERVRHILFHELSHLHRGLATFDYSERASYPKHTKAKYCRESGEWDAEISAICCLYRSGVYLTLDKLLKFSGIRFSVWESVKWRNRLLRRLVREGVPVVDMI